MSDMKKLLTLVLLAITTLAAAQEKKFVIKGEMSSSVLCYSKDSVKEVRLEKTVDGQSVVIASATVEVLSLVIP